MTAPRRARLLPRLLLVVGGSVLGLGVAELCLQVLAWRLRNVDHAIPAPDGRRRILCVGDSHTYGFQVLRALESYPAQLEVRLNGGDPEGPFTVHNRGWPALNGALVHEVLEEELARGRPELVLLLAGYNNSWNPESRSRRVRFQLLRLWRVLQSGGERAPSAFFLKDTQPYLQTEQGPRPVRGEGAREGRLQGEALQRSVAADLTRLVELCRAHGARVVLQTYASTQNDAFVSASAAARDVARDLALPLVDHARWFADQRLAAPEALQPDGHPTPLGYSAMVDALLATLADLPEKPIVPAPRHSTSPEILDCALALRALEPEPDGTRIYQLDGRPPGAGWQLFLSRSRGLLGSPLGLEMDAVFHQCRGQEGLNGELHSDGRAQARLYRAFLETCGPGPFLVQAVLLDRYADTPERAIRAASQVLSLELE